MVKSARESFAAWFDAFFILRPTLFFPSWTFFLAGYSRGRGSGIVLLLVWLAAALGAAFLLNQLADRREDRFNEKLWPLWGDRISNRMIHLELGVLIFMVIAGGIWAGLELSGLLALFFLIAGIFYNFPPFRLKSRPILGIVACAVGVWIGYLIGARAADVSYGSAILWGLPYALAGAAVTLLTHVPDLDGDRRGGARTFPAVYGLTLTGAWAAVLVIACALLALLFSDYILLAAAGVALPFFIRFLLLQNSEAAETAVKASVLSLAIAVGLTWAPFLLMIAAYYFFARWYHHRRLGLDYPSFRSRKRVERDVYHRRTGLEKVEASQL